MKDFLNELFDSEDKARSPMKAFAGFVALKFTKVDKDNEDQEKRLNDHYKRIVKLEENIFTKDEKKQLEALKENKVDSEEFHKFKEEYKEAKGSWSAIVWGVTAVINIVGILIQIYLMNK